MAGGAYRYNSGAVCCSKGRVQTDGEREVSEEIGAELKFEALRRLFELRQRHDAGLVDQDVEWALQASVKALTDLRSDRSRALMSMAWLPADRRSSVATGPATSTRRTAIVTAAPAPAKARTVSAPTPAAPPVTIAFRPLRSTPAMTSAAVDWNPKWVVNRVIVPTNIPVYVRPRPVKSCLGSCALQRANKRHRSRMALTAGIVN
jgi:hypothetical protein